MFIVLGLLVDYCSNISKKIRTLLEFFLLSAHKENCVLLNSVQEFIETEAWLFLTFFLCLHNQLVSITFYCHILKSTDV